MNAVFADTFYYIAMLNPSDRYHAAAIEITKSLSRPVVTSIWVLMEVADALSDPAIRSRTHRFLQAVTSRKVTMLIADVEPWYSRGLALYGNRADKSWSLTDCISFEIMSARGIAEALTGDRHFNQAGFQTLLAPPLKN